MYENLNFIHLIIYLDLSVSCTVSVGSKDSGFLSPNALHTIYIVTICYLISFSLQ